MTSSLHIALLGCGQLGGAFALALRAADAQIAITGYDPVTRHAETLKDMGGLTATSASVTDAVRDADIVILAAPVRSFRSIAETIAPAIRPGTIVSDLGSVKASMRSVIAALPNARVIPAHPIAGSEKAGPDAARDDLFRDKLAILTPEENADHDAIEIVQTLWHMVGADVLQMPIALHDQIYAMMSHLPHLVAFVAADVLYDLGIAVNPDDAMLQRFLRISRSNPRMWSDIFLENREALLPALATLTAILRHMGEELRSGAEKIPSPLRGGLGRGASDSALNDAPPSNLPPQGGEALPAPLVQVAKAHLPRVLASALISSVSVMEQTLETSLREFGAGGMRDIAAPAAVDPEKAMEEISEVAALLADAIDLALKKFTTLEHAIGAEDEPALLYALTKIVGHAHTLVEVRQ